MINPFDNTQYPQITPECIVKGHHTGWRIRDDLDPTVAVTTRYVLTPIGGGTEITIPGQRIEIDGVYYWVFEATSAQSTAWTFTTDTEYRWNLIVTRTTDSNEACIRDGFIRLFINGSDRRSHAQIMLTQINALLEGRACDDVSSYSIKSRSISKMSIDELMKWRDYYLAEIRLTGDDNANSGGRRAPTNSLRIGFR